MARFQLRIGALLLAVFALTAVFYWTPQSRVDELSSRAHGVAQKLAHPHLPGLPGLPKLPRLPSVFGPAAHKPPVQTNSSSGDSSWFSHWNWRGAFSSSLTLEENRAVLPPLASRTAIYTYYDGSGSQDAAVREAEHALLLIWRRAWWAKGLKPAVLGPAEAMHNPLYESVRRRGLNGSVEADLSRWLAWGHMGSGVLADWLALPMTNLDDSTIAFLRRGDFPQLSRFDALGDALFAGSQADVNAVVRKALESKELPAAKSVADAVPKATFAVDAKSSSGSSSSSIAYYDRDTFDSKYKAVAEALAKSPAEGLAALAQLINAHLHNTWQSSFGGGVVVLRPLPQHSAALSAYAVSLARNLTQCPASPMPASCPPNRPRCSACVSSPGQAVSVLPHYRNSTTVFTIGTVPHPYTTLALLHQRTGFDARFVRRSSARDLWLPAVTQELLGTGLGGPRRVVAFKDLVASEHGLTHSLWLTAEHETHKDVNWIFGFALPLEQRDRGESGSPVPGSARPSVALDPALPAASADELRDERELLAHARALLASKEPAKRRIRDVVEAWNLADSEVWRFARAFSARRRVERQVWEQEEKKYAGAETRPSSWVRWYD